MNQTQQELLKVIAAGHDNSRKLSEELHYNQEYIRRVVNQLAAKGLIEIIKEPRGYSYKLKDVKR